MTTPHRILSTLGAAALAGTAVLPAAPLPAAAGPAPAVIPHAPGAGPDGPALSGPALRAGRDTARVSGRIHSHHDSGWTVELIRPGETGPAHAVSTGSGTEFTFDGVPPGDYVLRAVHAGSGTAGPETPVTLRPGDNGTMTLVFDGPPPDRMPAALAPLTGAVRGAPAAADVVVEVLHDRDGELVQVSSAPVAPDGTFSVDPRTIEDYALPIHLRAVGTLPDGATTTVYHGGSPTPEGSVPIVPAEGVLEHYELVLPGTEGTPGPTVPQAPGPTAPAVPSPAASPGAASPSPGEASAAPREGSGATGLPPAVWVAAAVAAGAAVAAVLRRRAG